MGTIKKTISKKGPRSRRVVPARTAGGGAVVGKKGRVVIPAELRRRFKIEEGDELAFAVEGDRLVVKTLGDAISSTTGALRRRPGARSVVDELQDDRRADLELERRRAGR